MNNHNSLMAVGSFYKIVLCKIEYHYLPRIYIPCPDNLPKAINGIRRVSVKQMIRSFESFSGMMIELKQIINDKHWNTAWVMPALYRLGWIIIENIFCKKK